MKYQYGPLAKKLFVTIGEYNKAFKAVELDDKYRDPRPMLAIIARFMEANSRIAGLIRSAHDAVAGFPWDILPSDPKNTNAVRSALEAKERFILAGLHHHFDVMIDGEFFGLTALKQVFEKTSKGKMVAETTVIPSTGLYRQRAANGIYEVALIEDAMQFSTKPITTEERQQYIVSYFNPYKSTRPDFIGGLCRSAIPLTIIKNFTWQDWSQFTETFGQPFRSAEYQEGTKEEDKAVAKQAMKDFGKNSWVLVSDRIKFQLHDAARSGSIEAYEKLLEKIDAELAILVNGEANTTELPDQGGSRAAVQTLKLVSDDRMWWRLKRVEEIINEQYLAVDYRLNESESDLTLRPRFAFITDDSADRERNARIIEILGNSGFETDEETASKLTGIPVKRGTQQRPILGD